MHRDRWRIRPARLGEHDLLSDLALRSAQRVWRYPDDFMAWDPEAITVAPEHITGAIVSVLEDGGHPSASRCCAATRPRWSSHA